MKRKRQLIPVLLCLLLCGCGQNKIEAVPGSGSDASGHTVAVQEGSAAELENNEAEVSEEGYQKAYYTSEEASVAEIIQADGAPSEETEAEAAEEQETAVKEYASCLYPEHTASEVETTSRKVNGKTYLFFAVKEEGDTVYCTIAFDEQEDIFYLYDSEVEQMIPIEYDQYGIRLVG
ncbi:MAG: hypothetical protein LUE11_11640 [Clostridia bacterium]|nr:hypothetical protein [Clostridia bacterium]